MLGLKKKLIREVENFEIVGLKGVYYKGVRIINAINDDKRMELIYQSIDMLPTLVLDAIVKRNLLIRLDNEKGCETFKENPNFLGFFCGNVIYLKNDKSKKRFISTVLHEIGHFVDYNVKEGYVITAVENEKFCNIVKAEGKYIVNKYGSYFGSNNKEYFAQAFFAYVTNHCDFQDKCPKLSLFVNNQICNLV